MSYEPTLIIVKEDLHGKAGIIEQNAEQAVPKRAAEKLHRRRGAFMALADSLEQEGHKVRGVSLIVIRPENSIHNRTVRELLHELNIEFAAYD